MKTNYSISLFAIAVKGDLPNKLGLVPFFAHT